MRVTAGPRTRLEAHGLQVTLPRPWEARLYLRDRPEAIPGESGRPLQPPAHPAAYGHPGASPNPVVHLANFALPPGRGDFGTGAVEIMGGADAFASLLEYDADEAGRPLFGARGVPRLRVQDFAPNALQRRLPGQLGCQRFFTENGRAFCLYAVLGSRRHAAALVEELNDVIGSVEVGRR
jgi:hypothetical protein